MSSSILKVATFAEDEGDLKAAALLAASLRNFGGRFSEAPVTVCYPDGSGLQHIPELAEYGVELRSVEVPYEVDGLFYAGKPFAAAAAEQEAGDQFELLAFLDADSLILNEPSDFELRFMKSLAYRPVMHNRTGSRWDAEPPDYWARIFAVSELDMDRLFVMHSQADDQRIRPFFQAGCLVVRPELNIMSGWADMFVTLAADQTLREMCSAERVHSVFLHQAALVPPIVDKLTREELLELSESYAYPLLFDRGYESKRSFDSLDGVVTIRRVVPAEKLGSTWHAEISGPPDKIAWLKEHLPA